MKPRYRNKLSEYKAFVVDQWPHAAQLDWSENAAQAMHDYESTGVGILQPDNGYATGKRWIDIQIAEWAKMLADKVGGIAILYPNELIDEPLAASIPCVAEAIEMRRERDRQLEDDHPRRFANLQYLRTKHRKAS